ncbi:MAG: hypothetical protein ACYCZ7_00750 [Minisyncoccota bacterium]
MDTLAMRAVMVYSLSSGDALDAKTKVREVLKCELENNPQLTSLVKDSLQNQINRLAGEIDVLNQQLGYDRESQISVYA